jgi:hypothetical protein
MRSPTLAVLAALEGLYTDGVSNDAVDAIVAQESSAAPMKSCAFCDGAAAACKLR